MSKNNLKIYLAIGVILLAFVYFNQEDYEFISRVNRSNELGKQWIFNNFLEKGLFVYSLNPGTGELSTNNNAIRQLMASRVLAKESMNDIQLRKKHQKNLDFLFEFWYKEDGDIGYVFYNGKSKLGANAMLLRTLVYSPFFDEYVQEAENLARGILSLQNDQGGFSPWYLEPWYSYNEEYLLTFYSGEALLALIEYYEHTGQDKWLNASKLSAEYYIKKYVINLEENYYPAYVPWHTLALNKLYKITNDEEYANAIFIMTDKLLELQDKSVFVGRFYNSDFPEYGSPHASSDAVYTEGLVYAYEIAKLVGDEEHKMTYKKAIEIAFDNLEWLQYQDEVEQFEVTPYQYIGALRTNAGSFSIRVDTTQHAVDAFTKLLEVI